MRFLIAVLMMTGAGYASEVVIPDDLQDEYRSVAMMLALSDGCNKKFDDPDLFRDATHAFEAFLEGAGVEDANRVASETSVSISETPLDRLNPNTLALINQEVCGNIRSALDQSGAK